MQDKVDSKNLDKIGISDQAKQNGPPEDIDRSSAKLVSENSDKDSSHFLKRRPAPAYMLKIPGKPKIVAKSKIPSAVVPKKVPLFHKFNREVPPQSKTSETRSGKAKTMLHRSQEMIREAGN